jgi:hypothetical protein
MHLKGLKNQKKTLAIQKNSAIIFDASCNGVYFCALKTAFDLGELSL